MKDPKQIRLGFITGRPIFVADGLWTDAGTGRLIDALGDRFGSLTICLSRAFERREIDDHRVNVGTADLVELPDMPSYVRGVYRDVACRRAIREVERRSDVVIFQLPFQAPTALLRPKKPRVYHLCADVKSIVETSAWYRGPRRVPAMVLAEVIDRVQARMIAKPSSRVVANGSGLFDRYPGARGSVVVSSTLRAEEIMSVRRSRPADAPFRVLFVGLLRPEKGVDVLLDAFERIAKEVPKSELMIVGSKPLVDRGLGTMHQQIERLQRAHTIHLVRSQPFGPELFACFADADVLVVPSRSEGTPRVLLEARAFGCTVVASRVGGIPTSVAHEEDGLLVPPADPIALADAILRIARDRSLRARLVEAGIARARRSTVDHFAGVMADEVTRAVAPTPR